MVLGIDLGHKVAARVVVPGRKVTVKLTVKRVAGDVLYSCQVRRANLEP